MNRPPVSEKEIFSRSSLVRIAFFGVVQTMIVVTLFLVGLRLWGNAVASTVCFLTLSLLELFHAFNVRLENGRMRIKNFFSNRALLVTALVGIVVNVVLVLAPPLRYAFGLEVLNGAQWLSVVVCSLSILPVGFVYNALAHVRPLKRRKKHSLLCENNR